ncbi:hypothetical protein D9M69_680450 [compost metagenome]
MTSMALSNYLWTFKLNVIKGLLNQRGLDLNVAYLFKLCTFGQSDHHHGIGQELGRNCIHG